MADTDLGIDILAPSGDLDPDLRTITGTAAVAQTVAHRLSTPERALFYDAAYESLDLRSYLSADIDDAAAYRLRARIERVARADERVDDADVDVDFNPAARTLTVTIEGVTGAGPFRLVVAASAASFAILEAAG